jgi:hypothetical protein
MTCAKATVTAWGFLEGGGTIVATNYCKSPQASCPRLPGEGYGKCHNICRTSGHAEENVLRLAGELKVALIVVDYHYICDNCKRLCQERGTEVITLNEYLEREGHE